MHRDSSEIVMRHPGRRLLNADTDKQGELVDNDIGIDEEEDEGLVEDIEEDGENDLVDDDDEDDEENTVVVEDDANADDDDHDEEYAKKEEMKESIETNDVFSKRMQESLNLHRKQRAKETLKKPKTVSHKVTRFVTPRKRHAGETLSEEREPDHQAHFMQVLFLTIAMAFSAGIGAVPFFIVKKLSSEFNGIATAIACGVMFAASFDLIHEGQPYGATMVIFGIMLGTIFIAIIKNLLDGFENVQFGHLEGTRAKRMFLIVGIMAAHAVGEGCGVGVSFVGDKGFSQGILTTIAIGVHNIPEGMAKATVLVSQGASAPQALVWSIVTCLPQPLMAIPSYIFVKTFEFLLPIALGFAAGCMIWMVFAELLPEALKDCSASHVASAATFSAAGLEGFRMLVESLENSGKVSDMASAAFDEYTIVYTIGSWFRVCLFTAALLSSFAMHLMTVPIPVILGLVSVVMGCIGVFPIGRDMLSPPENIPQIHILSAAVVGGIVIVLLRNYMLERGNAISASLDLGGSMLQGNQTKGSPRKRSVAPVPLKSRAPLRALAFILATTSLFHAAVSGAQIQKDGKGASGSIAAVYGYIFGVVSACASSLWSMGDGSVISSSSLATGISMCFLVTMKTISFSETFIQPYPVGMLDTVSYIIHGAIAMSSFLTLAVGMSMNARYCRFGIFVASLCLMAGFGAASGLCLAGLSSTCSVDSILVL